MDDNNEMGMPQGQAPGQGQDAGAGAPPANGAPEGGAPTPDMGGDEAGDADVEGPDINDLDDDDEDSEENEVDKEDPQYRGKVLAQRALDKLEDGDIESFKIDWELANKYFNQMMTEEGMDEEEMDALYNESRNFGIIYNVFEANVPKLLESNRGKKTFRAIVNAIKGNKILHEQFKAYNNLLPTNTVVNVDEYINEALRIAPKFNKKQVKKVNEGLIRMMKKAKLDEMILIDDDTLNLYESIEYVTMNKKSLNNIDEFMNAQNVIKESIQKLPVKQEKENIETYAKSVNEMSSRLSEELTVSELQIIKEATGKNGEKYFNDCKNKTLKVLKETMNKEESMETKSRISSIHEKISNKAFNKKNAAVDVAEMIEIQHMLED